MSSICVLFPFEDGGLVVVFSQLCLLVQLMYQSFFIFRFGLRILIFLVIWVFFFLFCKVVLGVGVLFICRWRQLACFVVAITYV